MFGICQHRWTIADQREQPSPIEIIRSSGFGAKGIEIHNVAVRPVIVTYRCAKCGAEKVERV